MRREDDLEPVVEEILAYLERRPLASDSLEGITNWWLMDQAITRNSLLVQRALDQLVGEGLLDKSSNSQSHVVYSLRPSDSSS